MEEKRREAGSTPPAGSSGAVGADSPATEPVSTRRRGGAHKRKANALSASNASSAPSKRFVREKNLISQTQSYSHNGPLTRARQSPSTVAATAGESANLIPKRSKLEAAREEAKAEAIEEWRKASEEWEALEAKIEAGYEVIRSRGSNVHVVPTHCGWFSWTKIHPIEEQLLPSFFNGKSDARNSDMYMEIRNWIMKKFHANPNTQIELKDLSELEVGSLEDRQEVMDFLEYWGLINYHPFPPADSTMSNADGDGPANADDNRAAEKDSLLEKLFHFEEVQLRPPVPPKPDITFPSVPSGLFPESAIAEELVKPEGPAVEYHCNSCSADCSRERYHCQKQADFDLCTDCFNNGKFGSGMSASDFILMVPGEAAGVSGGKWTDQETLLLLEALELYKENWNEIAEHVATKTKAQCILHFVQMPIEDGFLDCDKDVDAKSKDTADPAATNDDTSVSKDVPEASESKTGNNEVQSETSPMDTSKPENTGEVKISQESSKPEDESKVEDGEQMSKVEDTSEVKGSQMTDENIALKALREAFEAVGYLPASENPHSFAEVGNPAMALAAFLALLVGSDITTASARGSLKSISGSSPAMQLAARHCFILEDPPSDKKEAVGSVSAAEMTGQDTQKDENSEQRHSKEDNTTSELDEKDSSNDHGSKTNEDSVPGKTPSAASVDESTEKSHPEKAEPGNSSDPGNPELQKNEKPNSLKESNDISSTVSPSSLKESKDSDLVGEPLTLPEKAKDVSSLSNSLPSDSKEAGVPVTSESAVDLSKPSEAVKDTDIDMISQSSTLEKKEPEQPVIATSGKEPSLLAEVSKDADNVSGSLPSEPKEPQQTNSVNESKINKGNDQSRDQKEDKLDCENTKDDSNLDKVKRAAITALSAAAVKAKLLAEQEEAQIRQLTTSLIAKQLQKLEFKLAFFHDLDNVTFRVREQLERSRHRLFLERQQIIATRLGMSASASRGIPPSIPANRIPMNFANSAARPPMNMSSLRPPMLRPMGNISPAPSNPLVPTTVTGASIQPSSQDNPSSVVTK